VCYVFKFSKWARIYCIKSKFLMEELHTDSINGAIYGLGHVPGGGRYSNKFFKLSGE
jgi:hypothetical protein